MHWRVCDFTSPPEAGDACRAAEPRAPRAAESSAGNRYGPILPWCCCWQPGQVTFVKSTGTGKLFSSEQTAPVPASCPSAPAEDSRGPFPQPGRQKGCLSLRDVFRGFFCCSSFLQVQEWGQCGHPEHCPSPLLTCDTGKGVCALPRGWQEAWSGNSAPSFASWGHLQQFVVLPSQCPPSVVV